MSLLAVAEEPQRGWGGPIAILIAFAIIGLIHVIHQQRNDSSPTLPFSRAHGVNPQVEEVPGTDDPDSDTIGDDWWGRIVTINGVRRRLVGEELLAAELADDEVDLALDELDEEPAPETLEDWVYDHLDVLGYSEMVREGMRRWRVSERTMKRRIAEARATRPRS